MATKNVYVVFSKEYRDPDYYDLVLEIIFDTKLDALKWVKHQTHPFWYVIQEHPVCTIVQEEILQ